MNACPKWRSLSTLGFCSQGRGWWGVGSTGELEQRVRCCMCFPAQLWRKQRWAGRQSSPSTGQSSSLPHLWIWAMDQDQKNEIADTSGWKGFLHSVAGVSLRDRVRSSAIWEGLGVEPLLLCVKGASWGGLGIWWGCHQGAFLGRCSWHVQLGGDLGVDPAPGGWITSALWLGIPQSELADVTGERKVWGSLLMLLSPQPDSG